MVSNGRMIFIVLSWYIAYSDKTYLMFTVFIGKISKSYGYSMFSNTRKLNTEADYPVILTLFCNETPSYTISGLLNKPKHDII